MLPISVCIIAKNEEMHIEECLKRLSVHPWEIVVVDTGSSDKTIEIAASYTDSVYHFDWIDDFSAARNFAISKSTHDWILTVDCDEYLEMYDSSVLKTWFESHCTPAAGPYLGRYLLKNIVNSENDDTLSTEYVTRFFHRKYYQYEGCVHEQLTPLKSENRITLDMPLSFLHVGYAQADIRQQKAKRNLKLLLDQLQHSEPSCYLYYQLGQCYYSTQDYVSACFYYEKSLELAEYPFPAYVQTLMESYGYCLLEQKQYKAAMNLIQNDLYDYFSRNADYVFLAGLIFMNNGMFDRAIEEFSKALSIPAHRIDGVNSYKAYHNLGVIYECTGNIPKAISCYEKCGQYLPALHRLNELQTLPT